MSEVMVKAQDIEPAGFCLAGIKHWAQINGLEDRVQDLFREGVPVSKIRAVDCILGEKICQAAEARTLAEEASYGQ